MKRIHTLVIGGGQAGLAMSACLSDRQVDHVVLERGRVAERWRAERWDSLRLLTPNWMSRLPGFAYRGADPDGYMTMPEVTGFFEAYASACRAPIETGCAVSRVSRSGARYAIDTSRGRWLADNVVIATGYCDTPLVPSVSRRLDAGILQVVPTRYRRPELLLEGGVLVVGASASGVQLADEIQASGRPVTLAVGRHTRLPRRYRGRDILWWMDVMGVLNETAADVFDVAVSRQQPALQLVGRPDHASIDLGILQDRGVRLVGRVLDAEGARLRLADDLVATTAGADVKLARLLQRIDTFVDQAGLAGEVDGAEPFAPCWHRFALASAPPPAELDVRREGIHTIVWATGFRREYPWLHVPVFDRRGEIVHHEGMTSAPGLYVLGLQFQRTRKSAFIDGVGEDARVLADDIVRRMDGHESAVA